MKIHRTSHLIAAIIFAAVAGTATAASSDILTSKTGMTLYTFDKDATNKSNCQGSCLALWPAVPATDAPTSRDFGQINREDGIRQLTYKNRPVYYYYQDKNPGDATGDKVGGVWHVIRKESTANNEKSNGYASGYSYSYSY